MCKRFVSRHLVQNCLAPGSPYPGDCSIVSGPSGDSMFFLDTWPGDVGVVLRIVPQSNPWHRNLLRWTDQFGCQFPGSTGVPMGAGEPGQLHHFPHLRGFRCGWPFPGDAPVTGNQGQKPGRHRENVETEMRREGKRLRR